jgi:hypothetical protein
MAAHGAPNECIDTLPEPEHRSNRWATTEARKPGRSPGFSAMLKLLAGSVVLRRSVLPSSKVSKFHARDVLDADDGPRWRFAHLSTYFQSSLHKMQAEHRRYFRHSVALDAEVLLRDGKAIPAQLLNASEADWHCVCWIENNWMAP